MNPFLSLSSASHSVPPASLTSSSLACPLTRLFSLRYFPGTFRCEYVMGMYAYNAADVNLRWRDGQVALDALHSVYRTRASHSARASHCIQCTHLGTLTLLTERCMHCVSVLQVALANWRGACLSEWYATRALAQTASTLAASVLASSSHSLSSDSASHVHVRSGTLRPSPRPTTFKSTLRPTTRTPR